MRRTIPFIAILAVLLFAGAASANITDTIVHDCSHSATGFLTGSYTKAQLQKARSNLPADVREYTGCYDQISEALRNAAGGSGGNGGNGDGGSSGSGTVGGGAGDGTTGGSGTGGSAPTVPATPHVGRREAVELGGATVQPGTIPAIGQDAHTLPTPLAIFLVLLSLGAVVPTVTTLARRVIARRRA